MGHLVHVVHIGHDPPHSIQVLPQGKNELPAVGSTLLRGERADDIGDAPFSLVCERPQAERTACAPVSLLYRGSSSYRRSSICEHHSILGEETRQGGGITRSPSTFIISEDTVQIWWQFDRGKLFCRRRGGHELLSDKSTRDAHCQQRSDYEKTHWDTFG